MPSNLHGSAFLLKNGPLRFDQYTKPNGTNAFVLGLNRPYGVAIQPEIGDRVAYEGNRIDDWDHAVGWIPKDIPGMACTFGTARSGKNGLIVPAGINYAGNMVFNDTKCELAWMLAPRRRQLKPNGKVAICDPFGYVNKAYGSKVGVTETVMRYNPLAELNPNSDDFAEEVAAIGEAITIDMGSKGDSAFFSGAGRDMIDGVIAAEVQASPPGRATLRNVRRWLTLSDADFAFGVTEFCTKFPDSLAAVKLRQFTDMNRTNQSIKGTAKQQTVFLDSEQLLRYFEPALGEASFSFRELTQPNGLDVFVCLPPQYQRSYNRFVRLLFNQAMRAVLRERNIPKGWPVVFICDEAGTSLGRLDEIKNAYGLTSGLGIVVWSFYQGIEQLRHDYPDESETFIANSATVQVLGAIGETAEYFSKRLGQKTEEAISYSTNQGASRSPGGGSVSSGSSSNTSEIAVPVMLPQDIETMLDGPQVGEMLVLFPRRMNYKQYKVKYFLDPRFTGLYRPDPNYPPPTPVSVEVPTPKNTPVAVPGGLRLPVTVSHLRIAWIALWALTALIALGVLSSGNMPGGLFWFFLAAAGIVQWIKSKNDLPYKITKRGFVEARK